MKRVISIILILLFLTPALADEVHYTERTTQVISDGEPAGELSLRFYEETPHIPYLGLRAFYQYQKRQPLTISRNEDGTVVLENGVGATLVCDAEAGVIRIEDWNGFFDLPLPLEDEANGWKDTATRFARITAVDYEGEPNPVTLDCAKYGIQIHADEDDIYLPVSTLCNIMTDIATNHILSNGENLYYQRISLDGSGPEGFFDTQAMMEEVQGQERPEDIVKQSYADLCFDFDYFFGHPGVAILDEAIAEKGLDQALKDLGEKGQSIVDGLRSSNLSEYLMAMEKLFMGYLSDGHTVTLGLTSFMSSEAVKQDESFYGKLEFSYIKSLLDSPSTMEQVFHLLIPLQRDQVWGEDVYRESGKTAIIRLDGFMPDEAAWDAYYKGEGDLPEDDLGIVISGLRRASENPEIENVIFDLTCNGGGSPDVMMAILEMTTGQDQLYGIHKLTGQKIIFTFETDANLDGVFDERDKEVRYDYNYGVLVTRHAFSCGNLFPVVIQEAGAVLIGEPSSGGSCCVQVGSDAEGFTHMMSSGQWQLTDSKFVDVEAGCSIDLPIETESNFWIDMMAALYGVYEGIPAFFDYYDEEMLDALMNEWFQTEQVLAA